MRNKTGFKPVSRTVQVLGMKGGLCNSICVALFNIIVQQGSNNKKGVQNSIVYLSAANTN